MTDHPMPLAMTEHTAPLAAPSSQGVDARAVLAFLDAQEAEGAQVHTLQVMRHGQFVADAWWAPRHPSDRMLVYSLSKTFTSAVVGLCVADGLFGYDDRVVELLPHLVGETSEKTRRIRVRDCLAMATGHTSDLIDDGVRHALDEDAVTRLLATEPQGEPGTTFCYNQIATYTLSVLVHHATGRDLHDLLRERILDPLGCEASSWLRDRQGRSMGFSGFQPTARTLASFFQLLANGGVHDRRQLLDPEWLEQSSRVQVSNGDDPASDWTQGYGWQVWRSRHGYRGDGAFGQYGVVLPEHDAVVVITGEVDDMQQTLTNLWDHLLPGLHEEPLDADTADQELVERLATLGRPPLDAPLEPGRDRCLLPVHFTHHVHGGEHFVAWTERDGTQLQARVGLGSWEHTTLVWPEGHADVAVSGLVVDGRLHARIALLSTPHTLDVVTGTDGKPGWARWRLAPLGVVRSLRDLCLHEPLPDEEEQA